MKGQYALYSQKMLGNLNNLMNQIVDKNYLL